MSAPSSPSQSRKSQPLDQAADAGKDEAQASGLASAMKGVGNSEQVLESVTQSLAETSLKLTDAQLKAKGKALREAIKQGCLQSAAIAQMLDETPMLADSKVTKPYINQQGKRVNIECDLLGYALMTAPDCETLLQIFNFVSTKNEWNKRNCFSLFDEPLYQGAFRYFLTADKKADVSMQIDFLCELAKYIGNDNTFTFFEEFLDMRYFEPSSTNNLLLFSVAKNSLPAVLSFLVARLDTLKNQYQADLSGAMSSTLAEKKALSAISRLSNQKDNYGNTLLHYAYQYPYLPAILTGKEDCVKGAFDPLIKNADNRTALAELLHQVNLHGVTAETKGALSWLIDDAYYQSLPDEKAAAQKLLAANP